MSVLKCKICGADINYSEEKTFGTCEYCGTSMTFPKVSDEQRLAMFNRGNAFRRAGEFDKALSLYENILRDDDTDAEAHWCCALCRFGIEYVEDPATFEYVPTCHRASFDSFLEDVDYKAAVDNADGITKRQYQRDAVKIADVQKGILATSQNEEPFDVFICYKETDDITGQRTKDSIDAQEIYYQLTNDGYRVFFSRITLEDKVGAEYEPYIFAALNSAKVMIAIGSKIEYFNAVWVKNEWSRFLAMMRKDRSKILLPCYREIDPYDMPEQLSVLQSYDMTKIGFIQDLIRGIKKVITNDEPIVTTTEAVQNAANSGYNANLVALKKRGFMALEDEEWDDADRFFEEALNLNAEDAECYLGKLMSELNVSERDKIKDLLVLLDENKNYKKACRFDSGIADFLSTCSEKIKENIRKESIYAQNCELIEKATDKYDDEWRSALSGFESIIGYKDSEEKTKICKNKIYVINHKDCERDYNLALGYMAYGTISGYQNAIQYLQKITDYKDCVRLIEECYSKLEEYKSKTYKRALNAASLGTYAGYKNAIQLLKGNEDYKDSESLIKEYEMKSEEAYKFELYNRAKNCASLKSYLGYKDAIQLLEKIKDYKDSVSLIKEYEIKSKEALTIVVKNKIAELISRNDCNSMDKALDMLKNVEDDDFKSECKEKIEAKMKVLKPMQDAYNKAIRLGNSTSLSSLLEAVEILESISDYCNSKELVKTFKIKIQEQTKICEEKYTRALRLIDSDDIYSLTEAEKLLSESSRFKDADQLLQEKVNPKLTTIKKYNQAKAFADIQSYEAAINLLESIEEYRDSRELIERYKEELREADVIKNAEKLIVEKQNDIKHFTEIYEKNANKIFGEGARAKKEAKTEIDKLTAEIAELKKQLK